MDFVSRDKKPDPTLDRFLDELTEDVMSMTDAELLAELAEEGTDPVAEAQAARDAIAAGLNRAGRAKLEAARAAVTRDRTAHVVHLAVSSDRRANVLARFANDDVKLKSRLTMAARKGEGITANEADAILRNLRELGAIDDDGNPSDG